MWLELLQPMALLGLLVLPVFILLHRASRSHLPADRRRIALVVRLVVVSLLILAASTPRIVQTTDQLAVAFLVDYSDSVSPEMRESAVSFIRQALASKGEHDKSVIIAFGEHAQIDKPLGEFRDYAGVTSVVQGG